MTISIYDMDRTLTRRGTWLPWLQFWLRTQAPWRAVLLPLLVVPGLGYLAGLVTRAQLKEIGHFLVMGRSLERVRVEAAAQAYAAMVVDRDVFPAALAQIASDRASGCRLVLATASNEYYARAVASRLGIVDVISTASQWHNDRLCYRINGANCYGSEKRKRVETWLATAAADKAPVVFYSDHESDLPLFELAAASGGAAIATNPSAALRAVALQRGWRILDWGALKASLFERA